MELLDPSSVEEVRSRFESFRYVALKSLIEDGLAAMLYGHIKQRLAVNNVPAAGREGMEGAVQAGRDPLMETVLEALRPRIEQITGLKLHPTYSFFRLYRNGDRLVRHRDRESCEVSLSLNLGQVTVTPWPLWIAGPRGTAAAVLNPGDALLYRGIECEHWRETFEGKEQAQMFLHYVDAIGAYREWAYDKRGSLNTLSRPQPGDDSL
jgi:hypothetical protein